MCTIETDTYTHSGHTHNAHTFRLQWQYNGRRQWKDKMKMRQQQNQIAQYPPTDRQTHKCTRAVDIWGNTRLKVSMDTILLIRYYGGEMETSIRAISLETIWKIPFGRMGLCRLRGSFFKWYFWQIISHHTLETRNQLANLFPKKPFFLICSISVSNLFKIKTIETFKLQYSSDIDDILSATHMYVAPNISFELISVVYWNCLLLSVDDRCELISVEKCIIAAHTHALFKYCWIV